MCGYIMYIINCISHIKICPSINKSYIHPLLIQGVKLHSLSVRLDIDRISILIIDISLKDET